MKYHEYKLIANPWLIQRAKISTPLAEPTERLTPAVRLDYMGAAEFEFGALPNSLRDLQKVKEQITIRLVPEIMQGESQLRVLSAMSTEAHREYVEFLLRLRNSKLGEVHLKERSGFTLDEVMRHEDYVARQPKKYRHMDSVDFWWDLSNDVMFSFRKEFMNRLPDHLNASWTYMDEQKAKK